MDEELILHQVIDFDQVLEEEKDQGLDYKIIYRDNAINQLPRFMMHHNDPRRLNWDLLIIFLAVYNCIMIPLNLTFTHGQDSHIGVTLLERTIDVFFIVDIVLNFRTTYVSPTKNLEITNSKRIAKNYVNSIRFPIDVLASIPFEVFAAEAAKSQKKNSPDSDQDSGFSLHIFGVLKLIRLFRLGRLITFMKVNASLKVGFRLVQLVFGLLLLVHWLTCIWEVLIRNKEKDWIPTKDIDFFYTDFFSLSIWDQYNTIFYYQMLLIQGNDCCPVGFSQTLFASIVVILGSIVTGFIFGNMAALMAAINKREQAFQDQLDMIQQSMRSFRLPQKMQDNVLSYLQYIHETPEVQQDLDKFFALISPSLRNEILFHKYSNFIENMNVLSNCSAIEKSFIVNNLKTILFMPDDIIIRQNEDSHYLYFINRGKVDVYHERLQIDKEYQKKYAMKNKNNLMDAQQASDSPNKSEKDDAASPEKSSRSPSKMGSSPERDSKS